VVASLGPAGVAPYHLPWPGTLSLRPATLAAVMVDVCGGLHGAGAHRIVVVNWHEGNSPTLRLAADEAQRQHGVQVVIAESHVITHTLFPGEMEFTHAGSMETAAVLAYDAALVHLENATEPSDRQAAEMAHGLFRRPDVYPVLRDFRQIAATGWYGRPERATPARAEQIAEAVADHVVARVREIWEALAE
jgi:creatinine amidohydrolase